MKKFLTQQIHRPSQPMWFYLLSGVAQGAVDVLFLYYVFTR